MKRNPLAAKLEGSLRRFMVNRLAKRLSLVIVTEFPKSGGSWFGQMLSEYLGIPFPRNTFPPLSSCIMHGHYMSSPALQSTIPVVRDGRDVMVSWYHHCYFINERFNERLVGRMKRWRPFTDYRDVKTNLPSFIEFVFSTKRPLDFTWSDFVNTWAGRTPHLVRYERLLTDPVNELELVLDRVFDVDVNLDRLSEIVEQFRFARVAKRAAGEEKKTSFLRKGIAGDWRNYFTRDACTTFDHYGGKQLVDLGYEVDRNWVARN